MRPVCAGVPILPDPFKYSVFPFYLFRIVHLTCHFHSEVLSRENLHMAQTMRGLNYISFTSLEQCSHAQGAVSRVHITLHLTHWLNLNFNFLNFFGIKKGIKWPK